MVKNILRCPLIFIILSLWSLVAYADPTSTATQYDQPLPTLHFKTAQNAVKNPLMIHVYSTKNLTLASVALGVQMNAKFD